MVWGSSGVKDAACPASNASGQYSFAAPSTNNFLELFVPGSSTQLSYRFTNGAASGSVPYTVSNSLAQGTYQLRLFTPSSVLLAISNTFLVGPVVSVSGTVTASGAALAGVTFTATSGGTCTSSNASGQYSCTAASGWSGSVTPSSSGRAFTPVSRSYSNVVANQTAQDYAAGPITYVVSGTVMAGGSPVAGVAFAASNGGACTASSASGQYSCTVPQAYTGTVTPSSSSYTFTPASRDYTNVAAGQTAQD